MLTLESDVSIVDVTGEWGAVVVEPPLPSRRPNEFAVQRLLESKGISCFLPVVYRTQFRREPGSRRIVRTLIERPIYPGYLFAAWDNEYDRHEIRRAGKVHDLLRWTRQNELRQDLISLEMALAADPNLDVTDWQRSGVRVRVTGGPMMGMIGEIIERRGKTLIAVGIRTLGQCVELDVDRTLLERIDP